MDAAEHAPLALHPVTNDAATAMVTTGCEPLDGTLKTVKGIRRAVHRYDEGLVIVVSAGVAFGHGV
jgi:hypothetical protein